MVSGQKGDIPIKFVDSNEKRKHILLLFEDPQYARLIEFRFLKKGLDLGEQCVYATEEDSGSIVLAMLTYGMTLKNFQTKKIQVLQTHPEIGDMKTMMEGCKKDIALIKESLHSPFRIVSRIVPNTGEIDAMLLAIQLEQQYHSTFEQIEGSVMCPYNVSKMEKTRKKEWLAKLREHHHVMIYAPKFGHSSVVSLE